MWENESKEEKLPSDVEEEMAKLLPEKSRMIYEKEYSCFQRWKSANNIDSTSEKVLLAYFSEKSQKVKPSTLWSYYSMLKSTMLVNENCDISTYIKLTVMLKKLTDGYKPKKSKIFEPDDIIRFLKEAPNNDYLLMKVVAIMGFYGACRSDELYKLELCNIDDRESVMIVSLVDTKSKKDRSFCIADKECGVSVLEIVRKYVALRPNNLPHTKFFINYRTTQPVGINTLYKVPKKIADFLKLPDSKMFTGHCFRSSAAKMVANSRADLMSVKHIGPWKSSSVTESCILSEMENQTNNAFPPLSSSKRTRYDVQGLNVSDNVSTSYGPRRDVSGRNTNKDQGKAELQEPPQFENIYIDESNEQHVDIKNEILDTEESFGTLTSEKIMQVINYDKNGHSIEHQMSLMEENVFVKSEDILEDLNVHIKNEVMDIKDEDDIINEDYLNPRLANVSIPVVEVGFSEAYSNNLPKIDLFTIMDYFHKNDNSIFSEIKRLKSEPLIGRTNYEDNTIGYVQVKHEPNFCEIKASVTPENDTMANNCDVSYTINTTTNLVVEAACQNCPGNKGGCIHCVAFLMWLHRRSLDLSPSEDVTYWKKPELKCNRTRRNETVKRKVAAEDSVPQEHIQRCKKRKIQDNIDTCHNPEFNSLSIQCLSTSFKKCTLTKNAKNFQKFSELHLNPELIVNLEEVTRNQSQSPLWQEMRYGRVPSSKAYDVIRSKTVDESLEENLLVANICDSEAISLKLERKNNVLKMLSSETSMQFFKTGILLSGETPFVEATPDAINDSFVVEIKCLKTEKSLNEYLDSDGNMKLKYFYQMQLQMRLAKKEKGIFVIAQKDFESSEKLITNYCDYDEYFANTILNGINEFWTRNIYNKVL